MALRRAVEATRTKLTRSPRQQLISALVLLLLLDYADRGLIGGLGPTLQQSFHMSNAQLGYVSSASLVISGLATLPFGVLIDRTSRVRLLMVTLIIWSIALTLTGAAPSFGILVGAQVLVGIVGAATGPVVPSLVGDLVPATERGDVLALTNMGPVAGTGTGIVLAAVVTAFLSFRWCFWLLAIAAALLTARYARLREPERVNIDALAAESAAREQRNPSSTATRMQELLRARGVQPDPRALLDQDPRSMSLWAVIRYVVRVRTDVLVLLCRAIGDYFFTGVAAFGVVFATREYGVSQRVADGALLAIGLGAFIGFYIGGKLGDALLRRGFGNSRVWIAIIGYLLAPVCLLPAVLMHSLVEALPLLVVSGVFLASTAPVLDAIRIDVIVPLARGRAEAIRELLRTGSEGAGPLLFGVISVSFGTASLSGLQLAFISGLPALAVAGLVLVAVLRTYQPDMAAALVSAEQHS